MPTAVIAPWGEITVTGSPTTTPRLRASSTPSKIAPSPSTRGAMLPARTCLPTSALTAGAAKSRPRTRPPCVAPPAAVNSACWRTNGVAVRTPRTPRTRSAMREQDHLADRRLIGEEHDEAVDANAFTRCRRHAVFERANVILVEPLRLLVAARPLLFLLLEALALLRGIVELGIGVRKLA